MENLNSTILISRNNAFDYVSPIIYKAVSSITAREYLGINQNCKYNHLQDYYYFIELLTLIKKRIDCIIENECLTYDKLKAIYDSYNLDCIVRCLACHNLSWRPLLVFFDIDLRYIKELSNKYLIKYNIQLLEEDEIISSTSQFLGTKNTDYTLNIVNPDTESYDYIALIVDNNRILPLVNSYTFLNLECIHEVTAKFRLIGCKDLIPTIPALVLSGITQTGFTVTWATAGTNTTYLVELLESNIVTQSSTQSVLTRTFTGLLPSRTYTIRVTATNCAGTTNSQLVLQTAPFLVIVNVTNGTSPDSGTNTVNFNDNFTIDFTSTGGFAIQSFKVNNVIIPISALTITGFVTGIYPQTGTYQLTGIQSDKYVEIIYAIPNVCSTVVTTYNSGTNTITIV